MLSQVKTGLAGEKGVFTSANGEASKIYSFVFLILVLEAHLCHSDNVFLHDLCSLTIMRCLIIVTSHINEPSEESPASSVL